MPARRRLLLLPLLLLVLGAALVSACGSSSSNDKEATALLNTAFHQPIKSANVNLDAQIQVDGVPALSTPVSLKITGPYVNNGQGKLPSLDLTAAIGGGGQTSTFGVISTGDNFYLNVRGQNYEVGKDKVAQANQQLAQQRKTTKQSTLGAFGVHPSTWLSDAKNEGDSTVAGTPVTHISAALDIGKVLDDLNHVVARAPNSALGGAKPPQLSPQVKSDIESAIKDPKLDVYVAKSDKTIRRFASAIEFTIPKDKRAQFNGITGGTIQFSIEFANVGQPLTVKAPANAKPISALAGQLNALGGALGTGSSSGSGSGSGTPTPTPGASTGATPNAKQFENYANCIQKAGGNDPAALQKCADTYLK